MILPRVRKESISYTQRVLSRIRKGFYLVYATEYLNEIVKIATILNVAKNNILAVTKRRKRK